MSDGFELLSQPTQRWLMARYLNLCPDEPSAWPVRLLDDLIQVRIRDGEERFYHKLRSILAP